MMEHIIPSGVPEMPLSAYIARAWPMLPGWAVRSAFKRRDIKINGMRREPTFPVRGGDVLTIFIDRALFCAPAEIVFEDGRLIAAVKPQGLPVDADRMDVGADTLLLRLRAKYPAAQLCHRLDAGTGGIVLAAADPGVHAALLAAFRDHQVQKKYTAIIAGHPGQPELILRDHLVKRADRALVRVERRAISGKSKPIETRCRVVKSLGENLYLAELEPVTGRTHQLRAHMAFYGHPILGDDKYGDRALNKKYAKKYPCLWCRSIAVRGAGLEEYAQMTFQASPPDWT